MAIKNRKNVERWIKGEKNPEPKRTSCLGDNTYGERKYTDEEHRRLGHRETQFGWTCGPMGNTD